MTNKLPSGISQKKNGQFISNPMIRGIRLSSTFENLEDHKLITAKLQWAINKALDAGGDKALAKKIFINPEAYEANIKPNDLMVASPTLKKEIWTLAQALVAGKKYWDRKKSHPSMYKKAQTVVRDLKPNTLLSSIDSDAVENYVDFLREKRQNKDSTIRKNIAALSKMLKIAVQKGHLLSFPIMERPKEPEAKVRWIGQHDPQEEKRITQIFTQWGKLDHVDFFQGMLDTGMRTAEMRLFTEKQVNFNFHDYNTGKDFPVIMLEDWQCKNRQARNIPITKRFGAILKRRMTGNPKALVFPYTKNWFSNQFLKLRDILGKSEDEGFSPHICRHTWASRLVQRGISLPVLMKLGGWKTMSQVMVYANLAPTNLVAAINILDRFNGDNSPLNVVPDINNIDDLSVDVGRKVAL